MDLARQLQRGLTQGSDTQECCYPQTSPCMLSIVPYEKPCCLCGYDAFFLPSDLGISWAGYPTQSWNLASLHLGACGW